MRWADLKDSSCRLWQLLHFSMVHRIHRRICRKVWPLLRSLFMNSRPWTCWCTCPTRCTDYRFRSCLRHRMSYWISRFIFLFVILCMQNCCNNSLQMIYSIAKHFDMERLLHVPHALRRYERNVLGTFVEKQSNEYATTNLLLLDQLILVLSCDSKAGPKSENNIKHFPVKGYAGNSD